MLIQFYAGRCRERRSTELCPVSKEYIIRLKPKCQGQIFAFSLLFHKAGCHLRTKLFDPGQCAVHGLFVLADHVGEFLAVADEHQTEILEGGLAAAELSVDLVDADEYPVKILIGEIFGAEALLEIDTQLTDLYLVKLLRGGEILSHFSAVHSAVYA